MIRLQPYIPGTLVLALTTLFVAALSASQGGYFPTSWGWSSAGALVVLALWAVVADTTEIRRIELLVVALFTLLFLWTLLSASWSGDAGTSVHEAQRTLVALAVVATMLLVFRRRDAFAISAGVLVAITLVSTYATATRIFPRHFGHFDPAAAYRLSTPIGYWNGLGLFAGMGTLLALGVVGSRSSLAARAAAAATLPITLVTVYFSFSRGSWVALGVGAAVAAASSPSLGRLVLAWVTTAPFAGAAVWYATGLGALTHRTAELSSAASQGGHLAIVLVLAAVASAAGLVLLELAGRRFRLEPIGRLVAVVAVTAAVLTGAVWLASNAGRPGAILSHARRAFAESGNQTPTDLNRRLFSLSSNGREELWRVAWSDFRSHPWGGSGAGTFEREWLRDPRAHFYVRDAHSLYLETLAELGLPGLLFLAGALAIPLVGGVMRRSASAAPAVGAYAAYLIHSAADWDWELSGVTCAALVLGAVLLIGSRREGVQPLPLGGWMRLGAGAALAPLLAFALAGWLGNSALASAQSSLDGRNWQDAEHQASRAEAFMPWSSEPPMLSAEAHLGAGEIARARASARTAVDRSAGSWQAWLDLAIASSGRMRTEALARAKQLYPEGLEIADARKTFAEEAHRHPTKRVR